MMILIPQLQGPSAVHALSLASANWSGSGLRAAGNHRTELKQKTYRGPLGKWEMGKIHPQEDESHISQLLN